MGIINQIISSKIKKTTFFLLSMKLLYCIYGVFIFGKLSPLGDSGTYLASPVVLTTNILRNNTLLISTVTAIFKKILFIDFFVHIAFCLISFWGLKMVLETLRFSQTKEFILILMLSMPSFGMWTSVVSKESLSCLFTCFNIIWILNILLGEKLRFPLWLNLLFLYLSIIMRPSVGIGIVLLISALYFYRIAWINKYVKFLAIILGIISAGAIVYIFTLTYVKDEFIPMAEAYFDPRYYSSSSTREFGFWKTASDLYTKAPLGIFIANLGPTLMESISKPFFMPYFFEGLTFIFVSLFMIFMILLSQAKKGVVNSTFIIFLIFGVFVILFINYPFGIYNPGSATRYRSSYYHIIVILLFYFFYKEKIRIWK